MTGENQKSLSSGLTPATCENVRDKTLKMTQKLSKSKGMKKLFFRLCSQILFRIGLNDQKPSADSQNIYINVLCDIGCHCMTSHDSRCHTMTSDVRNILIYMFLESAQKCVYKYSGPNLTTQSGKLREESDLGLYQSLEG